MKIRSGFVSNSSSSSFVALVPEEVHMEAIEQLSSKYQRDLVKRFMKFCGEDTTFCGIDCLTYSYISGNGGDYLYDELQKDFHDIAVENGCVGYKVWDDFWDALYDYCDFIKKNGAFSMGMDI